MAAATTLSDVVVIGAGDVWVVGSVFWLIESEHDDDGEPLEKAIRWPCAPGRHVLRTCHWGPADLHRLGRMIRFSQAEPDGRGGLWVIGFTRSCSGTWTDSAATRHQVPAPPGAEPRVDALAWRPGSRRRCTRDGIGGLPGAAWRLRGLPAPPCGAPDG